MARQQRQVLALVKIADHEIIRHGSLAYHDGYADARDYGQDGLWMPDHYNGYEREKYLMGFKTGLRVYRVKESRL